MAARNSGRQRLRLHVNSSVKLSQRATIIRYAAAGTLMAALIGGIAFLYMNFASSDNAIAGNNDVETSDIKKLAFVDLSHLSLDEMDLLNNRDFENDTIRKEYESVKWDLNSMTHLVLEVSNAGLEFSLELFNLEGIRVLQFEGLNEKRVFVDRKGLNPDQQYNYVVKNKEGDIYAGILSL